MPTSTHKCDTCNKEFALFDHAHRCELRHVKEHTQEKVVARHGADVWNCVCAIEAWEGQTNWHALVADELAAFRKADLIKLEGSDAKRI